PTAITRAATIRSSTTSRSPSRPADRKSTRLNSSHRCISYAVFCLKKNNRYLRCCIEHLLHFLSCYSAAHRAFRNTLFYLVFFFLLIRHPRKFPLFPYPTLFR